MAFFRDEVIISKNISDYNQCYGKEGLFKVTGSNMH